MSRTSCVRGDRDEKKEEHETGAREIRGVGDEAERIEKSKALALAAIERL